MLDFLSVASEIVRGDPGLAPCRPVIEKELLHFEILGAMHDAGLLRHLTFKGGTCMRLCYGGVRFSEDLDFSGGDAFDRMLLEGIEDVLRHRIGRDYGLEVAVKQPQTAPEVGAAGEAHRAGEASKVRKRDIDRWIARIVTRPAERAGRVGVQRIKIEVDRRVHTPDEIVYPALRPKYALLQDYFTPFPVRAASLDDICTDKLIAFPMSVLTRDNPRHRDIWDIEWIAGQIGEAEALAGRAARKSVARGLAGAYAEALARTIEESRGIVASRGFAETLQRFIPRPLATRTIGDAGYREHLAATVESLFGATLQALRRIRPRGREGVPPSPKAIRLRSRE